MKEIAGEVWEWKHLLRNFIYIGINIVFCSQNKSLLSFSLKIRIPVMQIFVNCSSWKAKWGGGGGQPL